MDTWEDGLHLIPHHMHGAVIRYVNNGIPGGSFLNAVLSNNLTESFARADLANTHSMRGWAEFVYSYLPRGCHGSEERVANWVSHGGLRGINRAIQDAEGAEQDD